MSKEKYETAYSELKEIINRYDVMNLISGGAPSDEYDQEISKILPILKNNDSKEIIHVKVIEIFSKSFEFEFPQDEELDSMLDEIFTKIKLNYF